MPKEMRSSGAGSNPKNVSLWIKLFRIQKRAGKRRQLIISVLSDAGGIWGNKKYKILVLHKNMNYFWSISSPYVKDLISLQNFPQNVRETFKAEKLSEKCEQFNLWKWKILLSITFFFYSLALMPYNVSKGFFGKISHFASCPSPFTLFFLQCVKALLNPNHWVSHHIVIN